MRRTRIVQAIDRRDYHVRFVRMTCGHCGTAVSARSLTGAALALGEHARAGSRACQDALEGTLDDMRQRAVETRTIVLPPAPPSTH
jgi:hypothetical protein